MHHSCRAGREGAYWITRAMHYPPLAQGSQFGATGDHAEAAVVGAEVDPSTQLSCGEHTDYGLLTLVNQESHVGGLQVRCTGGWADVLAASSLRSSRLG
jgi:isopenicillin N synthase-like dioxygenase